MEHLKGFLLLAKTQRWPYIIVVFQGGPITPFGLLQELHMHGTHLLIFHSSSLMKPWTDTDHVCHVAHSCVYTVQNYPVYLNHIVGMHITRRVLHVCRTCLSAITVSGKQMKRHNNECSGLTLLPKMTSQEGAHMVSVHPRGMPMGARAPRTNMGQARSSIVINLGNHSRPMAWHLRKTLKLGIGV